MTDERTHNTTLPTHKRLDRLEKRTNGLEDRVDDLASHRGSHSRRIGALEGDLEDRLEAQIALGALEAAVKVQGQDLTDLADNTTRHMVAIVEITERLDNLARQIDALEGDLEDRLESQGAALADAAAITDHARRLEVLERTVKGLLLTEGQREREAEALAHNASIDDDLLPCGCAREQPPTPGTYVRTDDDHLHLISVLISTAGGETTRETAGRILRYMRESGVDVRRVDPDAAGLRRVVEDWFPEPGEPLLPEWRADRIIRAIAAWQEGK